MEGAAVDPSYWERLGFPLGTLILIGIAVYRVVRWFQPWIERGFQAHLDFVRRTQELLEASSVEQIRQSEAMQRLAVDMNKARTESAEMNARVVDRLDRLIDKVGHA